MEPTPPASAPKYIREGLTKQNAETLREIARYADALADAKIEQAESQLDDETAVDDGGTPDEWDEAEWEDVIEEAYEEADIPRCKGSVTVNQIDGRGYYYLKWSESGEFQSQYLAPVSPKERGSSD